MPGKRGPLERRVLGKFLVGDGCWEWIAARASGYGAIGSGGRDGRQLGAHRVMYELLIGPVPEGLQIDHLCRNRACVNPAHLEPVTPRENTLRGLGPSARASRQTYCINGHEFTPENTDRRNGVRKCRECGRIRMRERYWRDPEARRVESRQNREAKRAEKYALIDEVTDAYTTEGSGQS